MPEEAVTNFGKQVKMKRPGQPAEFATAYVMLAVPLSSYLSGATMAVTGGNQFCERRRLNHPRPHGSAPIGPGCSRISCPERESVSPLPCHYGFLQSPRDVRLGRAPGNYMRLSRGAKTARDVGLGRDSHPIQVTTAKVAPFLLFDAIVCHAATSGNVSHLGRDQFAPCRRGLQ